MYKLQIRITVTGILAWYEAVSDFQIRVVYSMATGILVLATGMLSVQFYI